jgi:hypothetical protein
MHPSAQFQINHQGRSKTKFVLWHAGVGLNPEMDGQMTLGTSKAGEEMIGLGRWRADNTRATVNDYLAEHYSKTYQILQDFHDPFSSTLFWTIRYDAHQCKFRTYAKERSLARDTSSFILFSLFLSQGCKMCLGGGSERLRQRRY